MVRARLLLCLAPVLASVVGMAACTTRPAAGPSPSAPAATPTVAPTSASAPAATPALTPASSKPPSPTSSSPAAIPPLGTAARAAGLVDVRTIVPDAIIDLRYATTDNFTHVQLYPANARCLVHESMVPGLRTAAARLRQGGYRLVFWDCYRPHAVQELMFRIVPNPEWVARPGDYATSHESARSVDVTLAYAHGACAADARVDGYCLLDMGTGFDDFTDRAHAFATSGVSAAVPGYGVGRPPVVDRRAAHRSDLRSSRTSAPLPVEEGIRAGSAILSDAPTTRPAAA